LGGRFRLPLRSSARARAARSRVVPNERLTGTRWGRAHP
jgi:hypothetical protein